MELDFEDCVCRVVDFFADVGYSKVSFENEKETTLGG